MFFMGHSSLVISFISFKGLLLLCSYGTGQKGKSLVKLQAWRKRRQQQGVPCNNNNRPGQQTTKCNVATKITNTLDVALHGTRPNLAASEVRLLC